MFERELCVVVSAPSYRDTIYVGFVTLHPSGWLVIERAVNILTYKGGIRSISSGPEDCTYKATSGKCRARIPVSSVSVVVDVCDAWLEVMPEPDDV